MAKAVNVDPSKVVYADDDFEFEITKQDVKDAKCGDPSKCVVARAVKRRFGPMMNEIEVGSRVTKIWTVDGYLHIYATSAPLSRAVRKFDLSKNQPEPEWNLPPGYYFLRKAQSAWRTPRFDRIKNKKSKGGKPSVFKPLMRATPTRRVRYIRKTAANA